MVETGKGEGEVIKVTAGVRYHPRLARISALRSAFLVCVAAMGYKFAFSKSLERVRDQINNPDNEILVSWSGSLDRGVERPQIGVAEEAGIILVNVGREATILPWPPSGEDGFNKISMQISENRRFKLKAIELPWPTSFEAAVDRQKMENLKGKAGEDH